MRVLFLCICLFLLSLTGLGAKHASAASSALADYVSKADPSYMWRPHARFALRGSEIIELRLHSQTWQGTLWKHQLYLIKPRLIKTPGQGLLIIGGGRWRDSYETEEPARAPPNSTGLFVHIAESLGAVVGVLRQVPFQPLFGRTEDRIIAHTFERYLETGDAEWPLLLPMVKSAVRAMDATQEASTMEWETPLETFTVLGGSKRGWTTWLVGTVDPRVNALVPAVIDVLNMEEHLPYQTEVWGAPSEQIRPYTELDLHRILGSQEGHALREIVDPFAYRSIITQPKLIVVSTNDAYFPVDALNLYWNELLGPKFALYLPNDQHSLRDYARLIPALGALHRQASGVGEMPEISWEYGLSDDGLSLCIQSTPNPAEVRTWMTSSDDRDFRDERWTYARVAEQENRFVSEFARPESGYMAVFGEVIFDEPETTYSLSTNLSVLGSPEQPDYLRSVPRHGDACL